VLLWSPDAATAGSPRGGRPSADGEQVEGAARKARDGKLTIEDLSGGTFTIPNGGFSGSLMSPPILTPPQSGILGMHKIARRPMAVGDKVEIRPMMYVALSYDHRIVDGREAVTFLVRIKKCAEEPSRILFDVQRRCPRSSKSADQQGSG